MPSVNLKESSRAVLTVATWLTEHNIEFNQVLSQNNQQEGGLCHRLDTETSGVMVAAKNSSAYAHIRAQFSGHTVKKLYIALIEGKLSTSPLKLVHFLGSRHRSSKKVSIFKRGGKRTSRAELDVTQGEYLLKNELSFVTVNLHTGFRHQIRAQLGGCGHPLVGDKLYGSTRSLPEKLKRKFLLHAFSLTLQHPTSHKLMTFEDRGEPLVLSAKALL